MSRAPAWLKPAVDYGPLAAFLVVYELKGLMAATAVLIAASVVALAVSFAVTRKVAWVPLASAAIVGVFGGLTLWLKDDTFIKMKPTIIYGLFALVIGGGLLTGRPVLRAVLGEAMPLDDEGWRLLSIRFAAFFVAMAVTNEILRRVLSTDHWVLWKVPGSIVVTVVFLITQGPMLMRHRRPEADKD